MEALVLLMKWYKIVGKSEWWMHSTPPSAPFPSSSGKHINLEGFEVACLFQVLNVRAFDKDSQPSGHKSNKALSSNIKCLAKFPMKIIHNYMYLFGG